MGRRISPSVNLPALSHFLGFRTLQYPLFKADEVYITKYTNICNLTTALQIYRSWTAVQHQSLMHFNSLPTHQTFWTNPATADPQADITSIHNHI